MMEQLGLLDWKPTVPAARNSDPETSQAAAESASMRASHGRLRVLQHLADGPMTDHELAAATGVIQTSIGKRRGECRDHGLVEAVLDRGTAVSRRSPSGARATVWQITDKGREFLNAQNDGGLT